MLRPCTIRIPVDIRIGSSTAIRKHPLRALRPSPHPTLSPNPTLDSDGQGSESLPRQGRSSGCNIHPSGAKASRLDAPEGGRPVHAEMLNVMGSGVVTPHNIGALITPIHSLSESSTSVPGNTVSAPIDTSTYSDAVNSAGLVLNVESINCIEAGTYDQEKPSTPLSHGSNTAAISNNSAPTPQIVGFLDTKAILAITSTSSTDQARCEALALIDRCLPPGILCIIAEVL